MLTPVLPLPSGSTSLNEATRPMGRSVQAAPVNPPLPVDAAASPLRFEQRPQQQQHAQYQTPESGTTFAAAVLSGALTPTPKTLSELYARIGSSAIPETMQIRLKDLQV